MFLYWNKMSNLKTTLMRLSTVMLCMSVSLDSPAWAQQPHPPAALVINEVLASNGNFGQDPQGEYDDWIELHNPGDTAVDIGGMYLTDDLSTPSKWRIPDDDPALTILPAHAYLLIWADNDIDDPGLHAGFKLSSTGDWVALFDTDAQTLIDYVRFERQTWDMSFGRHPDAAESWGYTLAPTPGTANAELYGGAVADMQVSHARGFYDSAFDLHLTCATPGALIYYTLDGSEPANTLGRFPNGKRYRGGAIPITRTTCVRTRAIKPDWLPSPVATHTYIFAAQVAQRGEMSARVSNDRVWGPQIESALLEIPTISLVTEHTIAEETDEETSIEMIFPDGDMGFQVDAGIKYAGGQYSRYAKRSFGIRFRGAHGPTSLNFDLFGNGAAQAFDQIILRGGSHDTMFWTQPWTGNRGIYIRNRWINDRQLEMGHPAPHGRFVHVYLNGAYWGQYQLMERPNAAFMASYFGGDKEDYDALNAGRVVDGNGQAWNDLLRATGNYQALQQYLDVTNYADYMLLHFYAGNDWDWRPSQNWRGARLRQDGAGFKFFAWDSDVILRTGLNANTVNLGGPGNIWNAMKRHEEFKILLADRAQQLLFNQGMLTPGRVLADLDELASRISQTMIPECARWGTPQNYTPATWQEHLDWVKTEIVPQRTAVVIQQLRAAGVFPPIDAPTFHINGTNQQGGWIDQTDALSLGASKGSVYYTLDGSDPRLSQGSGAQIEASEVLVAEDAPKQVRVPTEAIGDTWKSDPTVDAATWQSGTGGVGYERGSGYDTFIDIDVEDRMAGANTSCYVRIPFNLRATPSDLNVMILKLRYDDGFVAYINGVEVQRAFFTGTPQWNSQADGAHEAEGQESFDISNYLGLLLRGRNLLAIQGLNTSPNSSDFLIEAELIAGQRSGAAGDISPSALEFTGLISLDASTRIRTRALDGSTWSALNEAVFAVGPVAENLRISEIMYHPQDTGDPDDPLAEYIELKNIGTETLNLNLVSFSEGIDFSFPSIELAAGDHVLVVKDTDVFTARYGSDIKIAGSYTGSLSNAGETLALQDARGQAIHSFKYKDGWYDTTDGSGFSLTVRDPDTTDPTAWSNKDTWRPSASIGGSPGYDDI